MVKFRNVSKNEWRIGNYDNDDYGNDDDDGQLWLEKLKEKKVS